MRLSVISWLVSAAAIGAIVAGPNSATPAPLTSGQTTEVNSVAVVHDSYPARHRHCRHRVHGHILCYPRRHVVDPGAYDKYGNFKGYLNNNRTYVSGFGALRGSNGFGALGTGNGFGSGNGFGNGNGQRPGYHGYQGYRGYQGYQGYRGYQGYQGYRGR